MNPKAYYSKKESVSSNGGQTAIHISRFDSAGTIGITLQTVNNDASAVFQNFHLTKETATRLAEGILEVLIK